MFNDTDTQAPSNATVMVLSSLTTRNYIMVMDQNLSKPFCTHQNSWEFYGCSSPQIILLMVIYTLWL